MERGKEKTHCGREERTDDDALITEKQVIHALWVRWTLVSIGIDYRNIFTPASPPDTSIVQR